MKSQLKIIKCLIQWCGVYCILLVIITAVSSLVLAAEGTTEIPTTVNIAVVRSTIDDMEAYEQSAAGFAEVLEKENITANLKIYDEENKNIIREIQKQKPALILTMGATATIWIADSIKDTPIVFSAIMDPGGTGITSRNIVGSSLDIPLNIRLSTLKSVVPGVKTIGVLYSPQENETIIQQASQVALDLGLKLKTFPVKPGGKFPEIPDLKIDVLWIIPDTVVCKFAILKRLLLSSIRSGVPVMGFSRNYARGGALVAISCDYEDIGRQSGEIALKILKGENYSHIKISEPRKIKLYLNQTVAHRLGIKIPAKIAGNASEVF